MLSFTNCPNHPLSTKTHVQVSSFLVVLDTYSLCELIYVLAIHHFLHLNSPSEPHQASQHIAMPDQRVLGGNSIVHYPHYLGVRDTRLPKQAVPREPPAQPFVLKEKGTSGKSGGRNSIPTQRAVKPRHDADFNRTPQVGKLWTPHNPAPSSPRTRGKKKAQLQSPVSPRLALVEYNEVSDENDPYVPQLKTRPIDHLQLVAEVKGIYAGLVMMESKCIEADNAHRTQTNGKLSNEQWQALIALHPTLLHEHHDFFNAPRTERLCGKYTAVPDRGYLTKERNVLELFANGCPVIALPDTGVTGNVMTEEYARSLGVDIDRDPKKRYIFENAVGTPFQSIGHVILDLALPGDSIIWKCGFAVVKRCAASIVLGKDFLKKAEVFTTYSHHLRKMALGLTRTLGGQLKKTWRLMLMESSRQQMRCSVDGQSTLAVADSGADINLVSLAYAQMRGWDITRLPLDEGFVILANGDARKVFGYVDMDLKIQGKSKSERFYVLDGLESSVILGDDTIDEFKVFGLDDVFVDMSDFDVNEAFCLIQWVERYDEMEREVDELLNGHQGHSQSPVAHWAKKYWSIPKRKAPKPTPKGMELTIV